MIIDPVMLAQFAAVAGAGAGLTYMSWPRKKTMERRLVETFAISGLVTKQGKDVALVPQIIRKYQTPYSEHFIIRIPPGLCLADFQKKQPVIEQALHAKVLMEEKNYHLHMDVLNSQIPTEIKFDRKVIDVVREAKGELVIPLGYGAKGTLEVFDLAKAPHMIVAGPTGGGKSNYLNLLLSALQTAYDPAELHLYLVDFKEVEFADYEDSAFVRGIAYDLAGAEKMLKELTKEVGKRTKLFRQVRAKKLSQYNARRKNKLPRMVLVFDEFADAAENEKMMSAINEFGRKSRYVGYSVILCTQRPTVDVINGAIKNNFLARVCFRMVSDVDSRTVLDNGHAALLPAFPGRAIFKFGTETEIQVPLMDEIVLQQLIDDIPKRDDDQADKQCLDEDDPQDVQHGGKPVFPS